MKTRLTALFLFILIVLSLLSGCNAPPETKVYLDDIPQYSGSPYVKINGGVPFFTEDEITDVSFENYSPLDPLGRCGVAFACIGVDIMPTEEREEIGSVSPSGWKYKNISNNNKYNFIESGYVYNRCHLIGFQLAGENANEKNLITGTRYFNVIGMLPFEDLVADYVRATKNHVLLRVTPIYDGENLVASGVLMEGYSVEDRGEGVNFCIYVYNVQPGVSINYFTGQNVESGEDLPDVGEDSEDDQNNLYIINTGSKKIHSSKCSLSNNISEENRMEFEGDYETLLEEFGGYSGCGKCLPDLVIPENNNKDEDSGEETATVTYVLNIKESSKKYHLPTCQNLPKGDNRVDYTKDLDHLKEEYPDYTPCGSCKPDKETQN